MNNSLKLVTSGGLFINVGVGGTRFISTSSISYGKRNVRKFDFGNKRGTRIFKEMKMRGELPEYPWTTKVRATGYYYANKYYEVPEMVPEFIVPDLTGCDLKPYVSYRVKDITQGELTAQDLFDVVYGEKIRNDFKEGKLNADGSPKDPSIEEKLTAEEAFLKARQCGNDLFSERKPKQWECLNIPLI